MFHHKKNCKKGTLIIFSVSLLLFLLLFSYKTALFFTDLTPNQQQTINFLDDKAGLELQLTENEMSHLEDVKKVMNYIDYAFYFLLLVLIIILTYHKQDQEQIKKLFKYGGITTVVSILFVLLFSLTFFDSLFTIFHQIFFPQGNWTFPGSSLLIQIFPLQFFINISRNIFLLSLIEGSIFILMGVYYKNGFGVKRA